MCKKIIALLLCSLCLCGCGDSAAGEDVSSTEMVEYEHISTADWDGLTIPAISPVWRFESTGDELKIFPHYNNTSYINVVKILISDKAFWKTVSSEYVNTPNHVKGSGWELITTTSGQSLAYIEVTKEYAYLVTSDTLPSGYVALIADTLCKSST